MTSSNLVRTCVVSRQKLNRSDLIKITRVNNVWQVDLNQVLDGRSIYLINDAKALNKFKKQQNRFKIIDEQWNEIIKQLEEIIVK